MSPNTITPSSRLAECKKQVTIALEHLEEESPVTDDLEEISTAIDRAIGALEDAESSAVESETEEVETDGSGRPPDPGGVRGLWNGSD